MIQSFSKLCNSLLVFTLYELSQRFLCLVIDVILCRQVTGTGASSLRNLASLDTRVGTATFLPQRAKLKFCQPEKSSVGTIQPRNLSFALRMKRGCNKKVGTIWTNVLKTPTLSPQVHRDLSPAARAPVLRTSPDTRRRRRHRRLLVPVPDPAGVAVTHLSHTLVSALTDTKDPRWPSVHPSGKNNTLNVHSWVSYTSQTKTKHPKWSSGDSAKRTSSCL